MAGQKFLQNNAGVLTEVIAEQVGGAGKANLIPSLDSNGRLASTMMPVGIGDDANMVMAFENVAAGDFVNIYNAMYGSPAVSTALARKADANTGKPANGFVLSAGTAGSPVKVYAEGTNTQLSGLTPGAKYFLSDITPGGVLLTPPVTSGHIIQSIGPAVDANSINFEGQPVIVLA